MMKLIQNIDVYAPQHLGKKDVLTINDKIVKIKDAGSISADGFLSEAEMINGEGLLLTPGFIDSHVHVLGGGGEGGFANRTPEATMEGITKFGVTTVVGCLRKKSVCGYRTSIFNLNNLIIDCKYIFFPQMLWGININILN